MTLALRLARGLVTAAILVLSGTGILALGGAGRLTGLQQRLGRAIEARQRR